MLLLICLLGITGGQAQEKEEKRIWKVELEGALNNYSAWEVEPSITYQPIPYAGLTVGLLFCDVIMKSSYAGDSRDGKWSWRSKEENPECYTLAFRPAIQLATPALVLGKDKDTELSFVLSPGLTIPVPPNIGFDIEYTPNAPGIWTPMKFDRVKNHGARTVYYHIKGSLSVEWDKQYILSAGYTFSDFDLYGGARNITVEGKKLTMPKFRFTHSFFLSIGYRF